MGRRTGLVLQDIQQQEYADVVVASLLETLGDLLGRDPGRGGRDGCGVDQLANRASAPVAA